MSATPGGGGVLRFGLVGDVPPAARDPYPCSGVIFPKKKGTHIWDFSQKRYRPILAIFFEVFVFAM